MIIFCICPAKMLKINLNGHPPLSALPETLAINLFGRVLVRAGLPNAAPGYKYTPFNEFVS
jgi:hypothetical protein